MSVLIKGMKMPTSCSECALNYDCFKCIVTGTPFFDHEHNFDDETTRLDNCPLVSVPPHGRLIDANKIGLTDFEVILCQKENPFKNALEMLLEKIENAPTIIEAEEDE